MLERRGLLARAVFVQSGDLQVKLMPLVPASSNAPRNPLDEGDAKEKEFESIQYGSS